MNQQAPISSVLVKPVSADCNLACEYCFYSPKADLYPQTKRHLMSDHILRESIAQYMGLSWERASFCWQGGEPTLAGLDFYRKAVKYQSLFAAPGQIVENSLQTNGILINEEWAKFLAHHEFLVGVSLDGPPELHDHYRKDHTGGPSFERVTQGIEWLRRFNVDFNILVLLNKRNIEHPRELYGYLLKEGYWYLQFIPCVEKNPETGGPAEYSVTPEQYGRFLCEAFDEWTGGGIPQIYVRDFDDLLIAYVTGEASSCTFSKDCGKYVAIEYNGDVYACDFYVEPEWFLGNLTEQPLEEIIATEKFLKFKKQKSNLTQKCEVCPWLKYCRGGCPKHWGLSDSESNYLCSSYRRFFEHSHSEFLRLKSHVEEGKRQSV